MAVVGVHLGVMAVSGADCTVVFNEIMYHPAINEPALEWVELRNQMAVDMELSGWTLEGSIDYVFPEGTIIDGGGYLVVALSPADLAAAAGVTNALGPFAGRLGNGGDKIELRNNNHRLMDEIEYGVKGDWPVAPDGAGPSLAKYDEDGASGDPANWRMSVQMGGSPGGPNFPEPIVATRSTVLLDSSWRYRADGAYPGDAWNTASFNDTAWSSGAGLFFGGTGGWRPGESAAIATLYSSGIGTNGDALPPGNKDPHYVLTASAYSTPPPPPIAATVMANHSAWAANDTASRWIGVISNGFGNVPAGLYRFRTTFDLAGFDSTTAQISLQVGADNYLTNVVLNGALRNIAYSNFDALSSPFVLSNGFLSGSNTLDFITLNGGSGANPAGFRVRAAGTAMKWAPTNTALATGPVAQYFRTSFVITDQVSSASLQLRAVVDDGAVFYLNGAEILRLNMPEGAVSNTTCATTNTGNAGFSGPYTLSASSLVTGTNVLAVELHQAEDGTNDVLFGAEMLVTVTNGLSPPLPTLAFNELPSVTNQVFWTEILNYGSVDIVLTNYVFKRFGEPDREYVIPSQTVPPGGRVMIHRDELGYGADPGDLLVLYLPGMAAVVDATVAKRYPRARWPEGTGPWCHPTESTPGATNWVSFHDEIVINEIQYHPRDPMGAATNSPEQWIELFNRGAGMVDLTGWRIDVDGETVYRFEAGRTLASGGYVVVAKNADYLRGLYPTVDIVGDFTNRLSKAGERIELFDHAGAPADAAGNLADRVHYRDRSPWPSQADGLGATLELRDPRADNAEPEAWAASDDRAKTAWQTYTYSGTAVTDPAASPTLWREFVLGLLDEGEVLLDDVRVVESPYGAARQILQNSTFETGANAWRLLGNHRHSEVIADPDNGANHVLRLVSDGETEHMHNHAETTLANDAAVTNGRTYEISFRAKWVAGCNRLHTRLYFNRLARTTEITAPALTGTPGAQNSQYVPHTGPTFSGLRHSPPVPANGEPVGVSVEASDPDGVASGTLRYSVNGGAWQSEPMVLDPASSGGAVLEAGIPGQPAGSVVQFYVEALDGIGAVACCPPAGTNSRALYKVADGAGRMPGLRAIRVVMTPADVELLHASTNVMSNERMPCTVIMDERTVAYDSVVHLQGSERGRDNSSRVGFTVRLPSDQLYRGALDGFTVDRSGGYSGRGGDQDEILLKHAVNKAGGLPGMYDDLCQFYAPRVQDDGTGLLVLAKYGDEFLDSQFQDGGDGELFKLELIYYPSTTFVPGDDESPKLPQPDDVLGTDLKDLGDDPEAYRWVLLKENHTARTHYAPMVALAKAFSLSGAALDARMSELMDVNEWMRVVAFLSLIGGNDMYTYGNSHNLDIYFRPEDGKAMAFLWDLDYSFVAAIDAAFPGTGSPNTTKLIYRPANLHAYYGHLYDLSGITGNSAYMNGWAQRYAPMVGQDWGGAVTYLAQRAAYVRSRLPITTPFAITNNNGNGFGVTNDHVTIGGSGPITVHTVAVNGVVYPVTWTSVTNWTVTVPLTGYVNPLVLQGMDMHGGSVPGALDAITVTNFGAPAPLPVVINEWMADNAGPGGYPDAADGLFQDWFELYNPNADPVDLSGYWLTDDLGAPMEWQIPSNTVIDGHGFLLVWADENSLQNGMGSDLHATFKLGAGGDSLGLFSPEGVRQHGFVFGPQAQNISQGLYPDGDTNTFHLMTNWTPRAANRLGEAQTPDFSSIEAGSLQIDLGVRAVPGHLYGIEFKEGILSATWIPLMSNRAAGAVVPFSDAVGPSQRVYRAVVVP